MSRVVMFVLNDCRTDARVLREAATLAAAGHAVTIVARTTDPYAARGDEESRDGFRIVRVPVAAGILRWLLLGRRPRTALHEAVAAFGAALRRPPRGWDAAAGAVLIAILLAVPAALGAMRYADDLQKLAPSMGQNVLINILTPVLVAVGLFIR